MPREWNEPEFRSLRLAAIHAETVAARMQEPQTVVAVVREGRIGFEVLQSGSYAELRERGLDYQLAPIGSIEGGRWTWYNDLKPTTGDNDV